MCFGYSNVYFGYVRNLIQLGRVEIMADGWEIVRKVVRFNLVFDKIKIRYLVSRCVKVI